MCHVMYVFRAQDCIKFQAKITIIIYMQTEMISRLKML